MATSKSHKYSEDARHIIKNVVQICQKEKMQQHLELPLDAAIQRATLLTGVGRSTIGRYNQELGLKKRQIRCDKIIVDEFDRDVIRRTVREMILERRIMPPFRSKLVELKARIGFKGKREISRMLLKDLGFKWKTIRSNRSILTEKTDVVHKRITYLRKIKEQREDGRHIVYIDETYINASHTFKKVWESPEGLAPTTPIGKGERLIIVHAGSENGFFQCARLILKSKSESGDYHDDMNFENLMKWLEEKLIPHLPPRSTVVVDNASYHNVQEDCCPTSSTRKADIKEWLKRHSVSFSENMLKPELLDLCKRNKESPRYIIDTVLEQHGHLCLRLPPYHADLNPIELIWADVKRKVAEKNMNFKMNRIAELAEDAIESVTTEKWKNCCEHVKKIEKQYWDTEIVIEQELEKKEIHVTSSDSDTDTASESDYSSGIDTADESTLL